jgi:hypothetical protein
VSQAIVESPPPSKPTWSTVEDLLGRLGETGESFDATSTRKYRIAHYDRNWRVLLESGPSVNWVDLADIRACWETFERLGRIERADVLEPGRCAAFILALFEQLPGVVRVHGDVPVLVLA